MVTTSFVKERGLAVTRPAQDQITNPHPSTGLSIQIAESGAVVINNRVTDMRRLVANIQAMMAEKEFYSVSIMAHPKVKHQLVVEAINLVKSAGIENVSMLVEK